MGAPARTFEEYLFAEETRQEIAADQFMAHSLPAEMSAASVFADVLFRHCVTHKMWEGPQKPLAKMHLERIARLRQVVRKNT